MNAVGVSSFRVDGQVIEFLTFDTCRTVGRILYAGVLNRHRSKINFIRVIGGRYHNCVRGRHVSKRCLGSSSLLY